MVSSAAPDQPTATYHTAFTPSAHDILIVGVDATTGDRMQLVCATTIDRVASDALQVELKDVRDVASQICNASDTPVVRSGQPY